MSNTIIFNKTQYLQHDDPIVVKIRDAARSKGWTGMPGFKDWAKETFNATLRSGKNDNWTSISFKTEQDLTRFKEHFGVEE